MTFLIKSSTGTQNYEGKLKSFFTSKVFLGLVVFFRMWPQGFWTMQSTMNLKLIYFSNRIYLIVSRYLTVIDLSEFYAHCIRNCMVCCACRLRYKYIRKAEDLNL